MSDEQTIRQIMPATGWRAVYVRLDTHDFGTVVEVPVVCFALLDPPYAEREDGPEQPVVPMLMDMYELVLADNEYWENERVTMTRALMGYLGPGEEQTLPWVQIRIDAIREREGSEEDAAQ